QQQLARERDRLRLLLDVNNQVVSNIELRELLRAISASLRSAMQCDVVAVMLPEADGQQVRVYALDHSENKGFIQEETRIPIEGSLGGQVFRTGQPWTGNNRDLRSLGLEKTYMAMAESYQTKCILPLVSRQRSRGILGLGRFREKAFTAEEVEF